MAFPPLLKRPQSLLLVGCGKMGSALLTRWRAQNPAGIQQFYVIDPQESTDPHHHATLASLQSAYTPEIIVFAVKPQLLADLLPAYRGRFGIRPLYLSIAAGKSLAFFAQHLGETAHVIRAMPNTPAIIGQGMTVLYAPDTVSAERKRLAAELMQAVGKVEWVATEALMDAATALSGSGPAYLFLFLDSLIQAGIAAGLSEATARALALQTVTGSVQLAAASPESLEQLRRNVTSPGGTTEAALQVLMREDGLPSLIKQTMQAAQARAQALAE